jgi:hypothetical protein
MLLQQHLLLLGYLLLQVLLLKVLQPRSQAHALLVPQHNLNAVAPAQQSHSLAAQEMTSPQKHANLISSINATPYRWVGGWLGPLLTLSSWCAELA